MNKTNEIVNTSVLFVMEDIIKKRNNKYVISDLSAAGIWGFSDIINEKHYFIVPKGYNPNTRSNHIVFKQRVHDKLQDETTIIEYENKKYKILYKEATFVQIIKRLNDMYNDQYIALIKNFFKSPYDPKKLMYFAKKYKIDKVIKAFKAINE